MADDIVTKLKGLMSLPPEERIKRLKEIEERNKKEIEEAHQLIQESEEEIVEVEKEKEQIPIPQVKAADIDMLVGEEERRVYATKRYVDARRKKVEEDTEEKKPLSIDKSLEETLSSEPGVRLSPAQLEEHRQYQIRLATTVTSSDLYNRAGQLMEEVKQKLDERGYLSQQQMREIETKARDIAYATLYKGRAIEEGQYKGTETAAEMIRKTTDLTRNIMQYIR